ncbi:Prefoldin [Corchorus capsularis]|uniref:Prefoldin n=1 Tax=Corchorus capsularis TaxID=210143 RepID=A0A1R3IU72_COCAP|nr:Prefoldin [Corchorus capsularis]
MDKKNSRSDLLVAGRKKKKDGKGSSSQGKSSKKSNKSEQHESDAGATSSAAKPTVSSQVPEGQTAAVDLSVSQSMESSLPSGVDTAAVVSSLESVASETGNAEIILANNDGLPIEVVAHGDDNVESSVPKGGQSTQTIDNERSTEIPSSTADIPILEGDKKHDNAPDPSTLVDTIEGTVPKLDAASVNKERGQNPLLSQDDFPDMSLSQTRGDQEADGLGLNQFDRGTETNFEVDGRLPFSEHEHAEHLEGATSEVTSMEGPSFEAQQAIGRDDASLSVLEANSSQIDGSFAESPRMTNKHIEDVAPCSPVEDDKEMCSSYVDCGDGKTVKENQQKLRKGSFVPQDESLETSLQRRWELLSDPTLSIPRDGSPVRLSQLVQVVRALNEDEYKLLLNSQEVVSVANVGKDGLAPSCHPDLFEKLKEELYLTVFMKDVFYLQLSEQSDLQVESDRHCHQLIDEISVLNSSLNEVRNRNACLEEELAQCRSELQVFASGREELQNQFHTALAQAEGFSTRANELQSSLVKSQEDLSSLLSELADYKNQVAALQVDNDNLNGTLHVLTEERKTIVEEKESSLHENENLSMELARCKDSLVTLQEEIEQLSVTIASLTEEKKTFMDEKLLSLHKNKKLQTELADCKAMFASLQVDHSDISKNLALLTEEKMKLEEENEFLAHEKKKADLVLEECQGLLIPMEVEKSNLNGNFALIMEEKEHFVHENQRLASELLVVQEQLTTEHEQYMQLEAELKQVTVRLEQLMEENGFLSASLDVYKAKMVEIDSREMRDVEAGSRVVSMDVGSRVHENATENENSYQSAWKRDHEVSPMLLEKPLPEDVVAGLSLAVHEQDVFDDSSGFLVLKGRLKEAEIILQKLEKAVDQVHSHSASLQRSKSKLAAQGVSKLIQAFESKVQHDEPEIEERDLTENKSPGDLFKSIKEATDNLRAVLKLLDQDANDASALYIGERDCRKSANFTFEELRVQHDTLKEYSDTMEATNIELGVLYEAAMQHAFSIESKNSELEVHCEALKQRESSLSSKNSELGDNLRECQLRISEMQSQLSDLCQRSDEMASANQRLETLQKEAADRALMLELEWKSTVTQIVETVRRLDEVVGGVSNLTFSNDNNEMLDTNSHVATSVTSAINIIQDLQGKLEAAYAGHDAISSSYKEVNEQYTDLLRKNEMMIEILYELYNDLKKLVIGSCVPMGEPRINSQLEKLPDPLDYSKYKALIEQLENVLGERLQLQSVNDQLNAALMDRTRDFEELSRECLNSNAIEKLVEHIENVVKLEGYEADSDNGLGSRLELLVSLLVKKYKEINEQVSNSREEIEAKVVELTEVQEKIHQLDALKLQHELEILTLKESLRHAEEALTSMRSDLQEKVSELEQSEQRVSSVREKLSIAVAKGKGLVVQRDGLKQSLAETSAELERCSQELQVKDAWLHELETKLKAYSEAGERVEALESELSYIRNSATALRESFLLKDSVLQRIEEILEDLDLPEHFHTRDIIEKVDWLARSTTGNAVPPTDWDQKSSVGGSHSDVGFVTVDNWNEDAQPSTISGEDLRRKYEDLQSKFYGLAEQNEMLEQSLMERNHLVQRWEDLLDRIDMPSQLRSMEPEERIEWLGGALSEANFDRNSLQKKIDNLEDYCGSLSADLEESERRISVLEADLQSVTLEREHVSERLENLTSDHHNLVAKAAHLELENEKLQTKVSGLQEEMAKRIEEGERLLKMEGDIKRLLDLVGDVLQEQDPEAKDLVSVGGSTACLEGLLKKLIENYTSLNSVNPEVVNFEMDQTKLVDPTLDEARSIDVTAQNDVISLKNELEEALQDLNQVKEERDGYLGKLQLLLHEVQALERKREELQEQLNQEEQKSASVREKLNVAVRKGKSLVQQQDSLKKTIEEMNVELENLKSELRHRENVLADYEMKIRDFSAYPERIEALEGDNLFLRDHLTKTERVLEEKGHILGRVLTIIANIDGGDEIDTSDPVSSATSNSAALLGRIEKVCQDLHAAVASAEQESRKSKRAAELLVSELNEVQERNDCLQEDVTKLASELTGVMKERDVAEAAKLEVLSRLEKLSTVHSEGNRKLYSELMMLQSSAIELRKGFHDIHNLFSDASLKELEFLQHLEVNMKLYLEGNDAQDVAGLPYITSNNFKNKENFPSLDTWSDTNMHESTDENAIVEVSIVIRHHLRELMTEITALKEKLIVHSKSLYEQCHSVWNVLGTLHRDRNSQKESFEAMRRKIMHIESIGKEKDREILVLRRNIGSLYEACAKSVLEIENRKAELLGSNLATADLGTDLKPVTLADGGLPFSGENTPFSEEHIKTMGDKLFSTMKEFSSLKAEIAEGSQREMKTTIANLRKELQEKDIQKDQICMELVGQIKSAEAAATNYSRDLQSSKKLVQNLQSELEVMREEQKSLQQRLKELQDVQVNTVELQDRVKSLTDVLLSKDQEIEALMQALDEEEVQMEELTKKIEELEKVLQQKNTALENLEASRGKLVKKLFITMSKFDELHNLSEGLLAEIEQLQSQLQDRDAEISFLRQEVTRCTNDVLVASQMSNKQNSDEINEFLTWFEAIISHVGVLDLQFDAKNSQVPEYKELIKKKIISIISELEEVRGVAQSRDEMLQAERSKVEELTHREETLKKTLHEKESQLNLLEGVGDMGPADSFNTEIVEVEPVINKWAVAGTSTTSQVRSLRKVNNDQVAIAIDADDGSKSRLEDEDEDKVHGFKSLTTSRVVPRFTRPISDMIDGLWVSCDRALMRQPALRLGIIIYWAVLHTLLAAFVF